MDDINRIHPIDDVRVDIQLGDKHDVYEGSGYHTLDEVVSNAFVGSAFRNVNIEDCVFTVINLSRDTSARYRIDAGKRLRLIPEE